MDQNLGYCGLDCNACISYKATKTNNISKLSEIADEWGKHDNQKYDFSDIQCNGCSSNILNIHCKVCAVRECGKEKGHIHCGQCKEFVCEKLRSEWGKWVNADWKNAEQNLAK